MFLTSPQYQQFMELMWKSERFKLNFKTEFENMPAQTALLYWSDQVLPYYSVQYEKEVQKLILHDIIPEKHESKILTLSDLRFAQGNILKEIKILDSLSGEQKKKLMRCYEAFSEWLNNKSFGWYKANHVSKQDLELTTFEIWRLFIETLGAINKRDELIARTLLQGQKRAANVLSLQINQIDFEACMITFICKKKQEHIRYDKGFMEELSDYITNTANMRGASDIVFITRTGKAVTRSRLNYSFTEAWAVMTSNKDKITPDSLRFLWDSLIQDGYRDESIMQSKEARIGQSNKMKIEFLNNLKPEVPK